MGRSSSRAEVALALTEEDESGLAVPEGREC
jgi:hypothetical protein